MVVRATSTDNPCKRDCVDLKFRTMDRAQLSQLVVFVAVAKTGSFRAAADQLGIAPSAVSHAVSTLEDALGLRLLARTTRSTRPTEEGERLLARVSGPLTEIETGFTEVTEGAVAPSGPLRITMPLLAVQEVISVACRRSPRSILRLNLIFAFRIRLRTSSRRGATLGSGLGRAWRST